MAENATKIVSSAIIGADSVNIVVAGKAYTVMPPTIHKIAGAAFYLSGIGNESTIYDIFKSINDADKLAYALSYMINDNDKLHDELTRGTFDELVQALCEVYSLISVENFSRLSALAKNVGSLIAKS